MSALKLILFVLFAVNYLCVIGIIFTGRKRPSMLVIWALLLTCLPVLGLLLYISVGSGLRFKKKRRYNIKAVRDKHYQLVVNDILKLSSRQSPYMFVVLQEAAENGVHAPDGIYTDKSSAKAIIDETRAALDPMTDGVIRYFHKSDQSVYTENNDIEILTDGEEHFQRLINDIENAKESINVLFYKINNDASGKEFADLLAKKAREGVSVRLVYDSLGSVSSKPVRALFNGLRAAGGRVAEFHPVNIGIISYFRLNYRNHRKIVVIDGDIGYLGGMNIGDEYRNRHKKLNPWRDTQLRVRGAAVMFIQERFIMDWLEASDDEDSDILETDVSAFKKYYKFSGKKGEISMQIVSSGPDTGNEELKCGIIKLLAVSKNYVYMQTPYFVPDEALLDAIKIAALSGVDVRIMLPSVSDHWFTQYASLSYVDELIKTGVKFYLYNGFMHAKSIVADDKIASIGSANLDIRSFALDFEMNAFIYNEEFSIKCRKIFCDDMNNSIELTAEIRAGRGKWQRVLENAVWIFSPLM